MQRHKSLYLIKHRSKKDVIQYITRFSELTPCAVHAKDHFDDLSPVSWASLWSFPFIPCINKLAARLPVCVNPVMWRLELWLWDGDLRRRSAALSQSSLHCDWISIAGHTWRTRYAKISIHFQHVNSFTTAAQQAGYHALSRTRSTPPGRCRLSPSPARRERPNIPVSTRRPIG